MAEPVTRRTDTHVVMGELGAYERYKLMASLIVPRPIALVTTVDAAGVVNAAPFSMFAMVGEDPPLVMISLDRCRGGTRKDTAANIEATGEFVVHLVDEPIARQTHDCGAAYPPGVDETREVGFTTLPCAQVAPPRIAEAPVAFECTLHERGTTESREVFFGRIEHLWARAGLIDRERWHVSLTDYHPVGRFGASFYVTSRDRFALGDDARRTEIDSL
ncbi:flavin reductase family protein [Streptomyces sp. NPDC051940]|uniref:flavin reductase family protein n=1 Tax=Streptomyces sp. NPDC051940 TaxID=3155675 RepID=UPI00342A40A1